MASRPPGFATAIIVLTVAILFVAGALASALSDGLPAAEIHPAFPTALLALAAHHWLERRAHRSGSYVTTMMSLAFAAASWTLAATVAIALREGFAATAVFLQPLVVFRAFDPLTLVAAPAAAIVVTVLAARVFAPPPSARRTLVMRRLATASAIAAVAGPALLAVRTVRAPTLSAYLESLPVVARGGPVSAFTDTVSPPALDQSRGYADQRIGPYAVRRYGFESAPHCAPLLARSPDRFASRIPRDSADEILCDSLVLRADPRHGTLLLHAHDWRGRAALVVFDARTLAPLRSATLRNDRVAHDIAVPLSWTLFALVFAALAVFERVRRTEATRWFASRNRWRRGLLDADGRIAFDDGGPAARVIDPPAIGHVIVLDTRREATAIPFREAEVVTVDPRDIAVADIAEWETILREHLEARYARTLCLAALPAAISVASIITRLAP